jgi:hypothetical protein
MLPRNLFKKGSDRSHGNSSFEKKRFFKNVFSKKLNLEKSRRKLQEDYNRVAEAYKSAASSNQEDWKKSVNSLDYEEIEPRSYERIKGSSLKVKSMENNLQKVGVPKAVWEQPGRKSMNIYNAHTASEMGYPYSSEQVRITNQIFKRNLLGLSEIGRC